MVSVRPKTFRHFSLGVFWADMGNRCDKTIKIPNVTEHLAGWGELPNLDKVNFDNDVVSAGMEQLLVFAY